MQCQVCGKQGHMALKCFYRFDQSFQSPLYQQQQGGSQMYSSSDNPSVNLAALQCQSGFNNNQPGFNHNSNQSNAFSDPNWFPDSGATNHITSDLSHLAIGAPYQGSEKVQIGYGAGLSIIHIGSNSFCASTDEITKHLK